MEEKAKRLIFLYSLGIEISEPYHTVISRLFEFFETKKSLDAKSHTKRGGFIRTTNTIKKNKKVVIIYLYQEDFEFRIKTVTIGKAYTNFLKEIHPLYFKQYDDYHQLKPLVDELARLVLRKTGVKFDYFVHKEYTLVEI